MALDNQDVPDKRLNASPFKNISSDTSTVFFLFFRFFLLPVLTLVAVAFTLIFLAFVFLPRYSAIDDVKLYNYVALYAASFFISNEHEPSIFPERRDAASNWVSTCYSKNQGGEAPATVAMTGLLPLIATQGESLAVQIREARDALTDLRTRSYMFATVAAVVGFLTTIVAAMNAWTAADGRLGSGLKLFGVMLPALGTLVAALFSIYAPVDTAARKAQLLSSLIGLQGDLHATLAASNCEDVLANKVEIAKIFADWNKRFSAAIAAAEFSQAVTNATKDEKNNPQPNNENNSTLGTNTPQP